LPTLFEPKRAFEVCSVVALLCALAACEVHPDTCTGGNNLGNPRIADGFDPRAPNPELHLLWDQGSGRGAELPASYFDAVRASDKYGKSQKLVVSAKHVASREIVVQLAATELAQHLDGDVELSITLTFPDRRTAIDCVHPASADAYFATITLMLEQGALSASRVEQGVDLGDF
jgi:hypothetical protein